MIMALFHCSVPGLNPLYSQALEASRRTLAMQLRNLSPRVQRLQAVRGRDRGARGRPSPTWKEGEASLR
jgi:hypothetical protein